MAVTVHLELLLRGWKAWYPGVVDGLVRFLLGVASSGFGTALLARRECLKFLIQKLSKIGRLTESQKNELKIYDRLQAKEFTAVDDLWGIRPFFIPRGKNYLKQMILL